MESTALLLVKLPRGQICASIQKQTLRTMRVLEAESDAESELATAESLRVDLG